MALSSLVADYQTDSEDGDDVDETVVGVTKVDSNVASSSATKGKNAAATDNNSSKKEGCEESTQTTGSQPSIDRLPNPLLEAERPSPSCSRAFTDGGSTSVFVSNYQLAEDAKQSILERHVKLTTIDKESEAASSSEYSRTIKPQVCQNFQRGGCRYGSKCRFKHDRMADRYGSFESYNGGHRGSKWRITDRVNPWEMRAFEAEQAKDDFDGNVNRDKKRRCGISDSLVPPKRALTSLAKFREQERPWTVDKQ